MKKKKKASKASSKKTVKKKAKKKVARKLKTVKGKSKTNKSALKLKKIKLKANKKPKKAMVTVKTKKAPSRVKALSLVPKAAPVAKPKEVTYSQESTRPLPGGFETEKTQVTEGEGHIEIDQETFSYQENLDLVDAPSPEEETPSEEDELLDDLEDDEDLPPHLR